jgi:hypothetical protein
MLGLQSGSESTNRILFRPFSEVWFRRLLILYLVLIVTHFAEHVLQLIQAAFLAWPRPEAGGLLGLWSPQLLTNESLHFSYNLMQLLGLLVLSYHVTGRAQTWWRIAIVVQLWHFFEHFLLQSQWLTSIFLFNADKQTGVGELLLPRLELHFIYNALVFVPTMIGVYFYARNQMSRQSPE